MRQSGLPLHRQTIQENTQNLLRNLLCMRPAPGICSAGTCSRTCPTTSSPTCAWSGTSSKTCFGTCSKTSSLTCAWSGTSSKTCFGTCSKTYCGWLQLLQNPSKTSSGTSSGTCSGTCFATTCGTCSSTLCRELAPEPLPELAPSRLCHKGVRQEPATRMSHKTVR